MGCPRELEDVSDCNIPGGEDLNDLLGVEIPEATSIKSCNMYVQDFHKYTRVHMGKFLMNEFSSEYHLS